MIRYDMIYEAVRNRLSSLSTDLFSAEVEILTVCTVTHVLTMIVKSTLETVN